MDESIPPRQYPSITEDFDFPSATLVRILVLVIKKTEHKLTNFA